MPNENQFRRKVVEIGWMLHQREYIAGSDGNISVRFDEERILVTATGIAKGAMHVRDLVLVDMIGRKLKGRREATNEIGMHLLIYRMRPDIRAIVHAHPRTATGFAAAGVALDQPLVCEVVLGLGQIPLASYGTPGTPQLLETLKPFVSHYDAILLANNGVVTYGAELQSAYMKMEKVEHFANVALVTHLLGQQQLLTREEVDKLIKIRNKYSGLTRQEI